MEKRSRGLVANGPFSFSLVLSVPSVFHDRDHDEAILQIYVDVNDGFQQYFNNCFFSKKIRAQPFVFTVVMLIIKNLG